VFVRGGENVSEAREFGNRSAWIIYCGWRIKHHPLFTKFLHTVKNATCIDVSVNFAQVYTVRMASVLCS